ncbi:MAG: dihydropteroate synthase [Bacteroidales bacterium]|nr:dihydropteroate synthase [Bacteroidales bacterium]
MGIINVTPDSFYRGSRFTNDAGIINAASKMIEEGADIIDVGGYSSRPGAAHISETEEKKRVLGAIRLIARERPDAVISVDTFRADIAREAVGECGAHMINDISGGESDSRMFDVVGDLNVPYVMMHMKGNPRTMQVNPVYTDVVAEILTWFGKRIFRLRSAGVKDIILDPGFGFGKSIDHNFGILRSLSDFSITGLPLMVGLSRKSMIWKTLGITSDESLNGTTVLNSVALLNGADILRVHDVREAVQAIRLTARLGKNKIFP